MFKLLEKTPPIFFAVLLAGIYHNSAQAQLEANEIINQIEQYEKESREDSIERITNVNQLRDVSPTNWSYEALRSLSDRYGCISGFPDGTFKGDRPITRNEFAAGLNSCFEQIERSINSQKQAYINAIFFGGTFKIFEKDGAITTIHNDSGSFLDPQITTTSIKIDSLEIDSLENNQFSTTTKLTGETIFGISNTFEGF